MSSTKFVNRGGFVMGEVPAGPFWIEYQHSLESTQAEKIPTFALTRDELLLLVKYAYSEILDIDWRWFCSRRSRTDWRRAAQFGYRLASFETILGQGAVNQVIEEVRESFRRSLQSYQDQETWRIFTRGAMGTRGPCRRIVAGT
jgi:hypothetical protein